MKGKGRRMFLCRIVCTLRNEKGGVNDGCEEDGVACEPSCQKVTHDNVRLRIRQQIGSKESKAMIDLNSPVV